MRDEWSGESGGEGSQLQYFDCIRCLQIQPNDVLTDMMPRYYEKYSGEIQNVGLVPVFQLYMYSINGYNCFRVKSASRAEQKSGAEQERQRCMLLFIALRNNIKQY